MNWIFDRIPGFNKIDADAESLTKKFGIFGDTVVIGLLIGIVVGFLAGYDAGYRVAWYANSRSYENNAKNGCNVYGRAVANR